LNTAGGKIGKGAGELEDGSFNVWINEDDLLEKRTGFVRGLDERFDGPVCGLFSYLDHCGGEWLLVADSLGISIRQPFTLPIFGTSDAYPNDSFALVDGDPLDPADWRNAARYEIQTDKMVLVPATVATTNAVSTMARWFKDAANKNYEIQVQFEFDPVAVKQVVASAVRGSTDLAGALIYATVEYIQGGSFVAKLFHRNSGGVDTELLVRPLTGSTTGFFTVQYNSVTRQPGLSLSITGGTILETVFGEPLTVVEDADLGLVSGIGLTTVGGTVSNVFGIESVTSGPI
jgi:hypothetical protein